jgi:hypothetical protein
MRTLIGPMVCKGCRAHVWGVDRRTVEVPCGACLCSSEHPGDYMTAFITHTHAVPDVGPATVVEADGIRHECAA